MGGGTRDPSTDMRSLDYFLVLCEVPSFLFSLPRVTFLPDGMIPAIPSFFTSENLPERPPHSQKSFCRSQKVFCLFFSCLPRRGQPMVNITMEQARFGADPIVLHTQISQFFFFFCPRSNPDPTLPTVPFLPPFLPPQLEPTKTFPPLAMVQCLMLFKASPYLL